MGLIELQKLLAAIYTDAELRARFRESPQRVAEEWNLSPSDWEQLRQVPGGQIDEFGDGLIRKRWGHVRDLAPLTTRALGDEGLPCFREHAENFRPRGIKKHLRDAERFCDAVLQRPELFKRRGTWFRDVVRLEQGWARATRLTRCCFWRNLSHLPADLDAHVREGAPIRRRRCAVLWLRWGAGFHLQSRLVQGPRF
ncbi:MAG: hypothetical protein N2C14_14500 [Planctomycetales bacterium]